MLVFIPFHFFTLAIYLLCMMVQILIMLWRILEGVLSLLLPPAHHCPSPSKSKGLHAKSSLSPYTNDGSKHDAVNSALVSVQVVKDKVSHLVQDGSGYPLAGKIQDAKSRTSIHSDTTDSQPPIENCGSKGCSSHHAFKYFRSVQHKSTKTTQQKAPKAIKDGCILCFLKPTKASPSMPEEPKQLSVTEEECSGLAHALPFTNDRRDSAQTEYPDYGASSERSSIPSVVAKDSIRIQEAIANAVAKANGKWRIAQQKLEDKHKKGVQQLTKDLTASKQQFQKLQATLDTNEKEHEANIEELQDEIATLKDDHAAEIKAKDDEIACKDRAISGLQRSFDSMVADNDKLEQQQHSLLARREQLVADLKVFEEQLKDRVASLADVRGRLEPALERAARNFTKKYNETVRNLNLHREFGIWCFQQLVWAKYNSTLKEGVEVDKESRDAIIDGAFNLLGLSERGVEVQDTTYRLAAGMRLFFAQEDVEDGELAHWFVDEGEADGANEDNNTEVGDSGQDEGNGHEADRLPIFTEEAAHVMPVGLGRRLITEGGYVDGEERDPHVTEAIVSHCESGSPTHAETPSQRLESTDDGASGVHDVRSDTVEEARSSSSPADTGLDTSSRQAESSADTERFEERMGAALGLDERSPTLEGHPAISNTDNAISISQPITTSKSSSNSDDTAHSLAALNTSSPPTSVASSASSLSQDHDQPATAALNPNERVANGTVFFSNPFADQRPHATPSSWTFFDRSSPNDFSFGNTRTTFSALSPSTSASGKAQESTSSSSLPASANSPVAAAPQPDERATERKVFNNFPAPSTDSKTSSTTRSWGTFNPASAVDTNFGSRPVAFSASTPAIKVPKGDAVDTVPPTRASNTVNATESSLSPQNDRPAREDAPKKARSHPQEQ
ncbi:MAG: hypothetical protein Q9164_002930, partial [Protoblastenia rupestris]